MNENKPQVNASELTGARIIKGATILAVAGLISKVFGAFFRIPLTNLIGAEGMSFYGVAYPVYSFFLILATAGIPVAISRMVSERTAIGDYRNAHKSYKVSFALMFAIGIVSFAICFFGADVIATKMGNPGAKASLMAIAPALLLAPIVSSFRGYFQGQQNMMPTAVSEVSEQMLRVIVGLVLAFALVKVSLEYASAGATFGASAGLVASLLVLSFIYIRNRKKREALLAKSIERTESNGSLLKELFRISIPITIGSTIMPLMMIIDSMIIMNRLQATGWSYSNAKTLYGLISGFCDPLIGFPGVFIDAICISLMPAVTAAYTLKIKKDLDKSIQSSMKLMMIVAFPCAMGLIALAKPILTMLYPMQMEEAIMAVPNLQILSLSVITLSLMRVLSSALQGIGRMVLPVVNLFIGSIVKIIVSYALVGIPSLNINGAAIGSVSAYLVAGILNYIAIRKYAGTHINVFKTFTGPLVSTLIMGAATVGSYKLFYIVIGKNSLATLLSIIIAVIVYAVAVFVTKTMDREDVLKLPKGELLVKLTDKVGFTREEYKPKH